MRHLEGPEEIQMYCSDIIHIYRAVYEVHMYIYMLGYRQKSGLTAFLFSLTYFFFYKKEKKNMCANHQYLKSKLDLSAYTLNQGY